MMSEDRVSAYARSNMSEKRYGGGGGQELESMNIPII